MGPRIFFQWRSSNSLVIQRAGLGIPDRPALLQFLHATGSSVFQAVRWLTRHVSLVVQKVCSDLTTHLVFI